MSSAGKRISSAFGSGNRPLFKSGPVRVGIPWSRVDRHLHRGRWRP